MSAILGFERTRPRYVAYRSLPLAFSGTPLAALRVSHDSGDLDTAGSGIPREEILSVLRGEEEVEDL